MSQQSLASLIKQELAVLKEKYLFAVDDTLQDPVFDGVVRNFHSFFECLTSMNSRVEKFTLSIEAFSTEVISMSEALLENYKSAVSLDTLIVSDCYKMREASNQIGRLDAPHSAASKFKRDLEYNVSTPLRSHLNNCRQIRNIIDLRNRKLVELSAAERRGSSPEADQLRSEFDQVDQHLFDWFMILEEYRGDILDSLLQTLKYLEYEFFACSAHAIAAVLPARMEFRPMVEMTPKQLEHQLGIEKRANAELHNGSSSNDKNVWEQESPSVGAMGSGQRGLSDYSKRLIQKNETPASPLAEEPVDILSLSSLMAQGFEEGGARKALRECRNDTQAALDVLLNGRKAASSDDSEGVRMPTTLKRIQRMKDLKRRLAERKEIRESEAIAEPPKYLPEIAPLIDVNSTGNDFISKDYEKPDLPPLGDLLFS